MNPKITGIVTMEDLPAKEIYFKLDRHSFSNIKLKIKKQKFDDIIKNPRKEYIYHIGVYTSTLDKIGREQGYFTVRDLSNHFDKSLRHSRRIIRLLHNKDKIRLIEPACKGHCNISYAKYIFK